MSFLNLQPAESTDSGMARGGDVVVTSGYKIILTVYLARNTLFLALARHVGATSEHLIVVILEFVKVKGNLLKSNLTAKGRGIISSWQTLGFGF